ncbi:hypothetical protein IV203_006126 [Nitzschia inconspicua]|uniref:Uncharacterized protein n=1 Tax=Nitzschia inconspicua TaxID=303405 RepID=A0A9K3KNJ0_9STRA|nr:hypothetical protein IV203_006126 [Nitzschia inconspicua]
MGCCASQPTAEATAKDPTTNAEKAKETGSDLALQSGEANGGTMTSIPPEAPMPDPTAPPTTVPEQTSGAAQSPTPKSYVAPAPGVKHVREAYQGKGWAPPQKEWEATEKRKGDKTRIEVEDEWDEDGNLRRTTIKHITTPDWKVKKEKTIEIIPAEEAEKMGLGRKP